MFLFSALLVSKPTAC